MYTATLGRGPSKWCCLTWSFVFQMDLKSLSHCQQLLQGRQWRFKILVKHHISSGAFSTHGWAGVIEFMRNHHLFQSKVSWVNLRQGWLAGRGEHFKPTQPLLLQPGLLPAQSLQGVGVYLASAYSLPPRFTCWPMPAVTQVFLAPFADIFQPVCLFRFMLFTAVVLVFNRENVTGQLPCLETLGKSFNPSYLVCRSAK